MQLYSHAYPKKCLAHHMDRIYAFIRLMENATRSRKYKLIYGYKASEPSWRSRDLWITNKPYGSAFQYQPAFEIVAKFIQNILIV